MNRSLLVNLLGLLKIEGFMKLFLFVCLTFISNFLFAEKIHFTRSFSVKDVACCAGRMEDVYFMNFYLMNEDNTKTARAECKGFWQKSELFLYVTDAGHFDILKSRIYKAQFADESSCSWKLKELSKTRSQLPFVFNSEEKISVFNELTDVSWQSQSR